MVQVEPCPLRTETTCPLPEATKTRSVSRNGRSVPRAWAVGWLPRAAAPRRASWHHFALARGIINPRRSAWYRSWKLRSQKRGE